MELVDYGLDSPNSVAALCVDKNIISRYDLGRVKVEAEKAVDPVLVHLFDSGLEFFDSYSFQVGFIEIYCLP